MRALILFLTATSLFGVVGRVQAQEKAIPAPTTPLTRSELDKRIAELVYAATKEGVELYNTGKQERCLGLYQGSLIVIQGMLDHRPATATLVQEALANAKKQPVAEAAFTLRAALDTVQDTIVGVAKTTTPTTKKPLWERLGGEPAVRAVVKDFVALAATDPKVNFDRGGKYKLDAAAVAKLEQSLVEMISANTGGPLKYTGQSMKEAHAGMKITEDEFNAMAVDLVATLKKYKVPQPEIDELVAIVASTKDAIVEVKSK